MVDASATFLASRMSRNVTNLALSTSYASAYILLLHAALATWSRRVNGVVTEPYLDEVFHVRQAQTYCNQGLFSQWDPKITTPPGLYVVSWLLNRFINSFYCSLNGLRFTNALLPASLWFICYRILIQGLCIHHFSLSSRVQQLKHLARSMHKALNVCLFPPLFFFCALYYTDVISTTSVLVTLLLRTESSLKTKSNLRKALLFGNGMIALSFRQTNIFWVAVFPAILDAIDVVTQQAEYTMDRPSQSDHPWGPDVGVVERMSFSPTTHPVLSAIARSSLQGDILFDLPVTDAIWDDYLRVPLSIGLAAVRSWKLVFSAIAPYVLLVITFGTFLIWNGGVVLGDKSNHIATLHLPQMLYIWPLIAFFSWPLLYPHILANLLPYRLLPANLGLYRPKFPDHKRSTIESPLSPNHLYIFMLRSLLALGLLTLAYFMVKHNTIIHPFTLADNRHYVFYVFRILLWHPHVRYLAIPVYIGCGWAVLQALCKPCAPPFRGIKVQGETFNVRVFEWWWTKQEDHSWETNDYTELTTDTTMVSYALTWLVTTTMTLITAPLVEPRYFILPWIFWRLAVPSPQRPRDTSQAELKSNSRHADRAAEKEVQATLERRIYDRRVEESMRVRSIEDEAKNFVRAEQERKRSRKLVLFDLMNHGDHRLWLETLWFLIINAATGYMFLYKGFLWPQEPGKIQRFMW